MTLDQYAHLVLGPTTSGQHVTPDNAMRAAAVAACVRVLVTTAASLPVDAILRQGSIRRELDPAPRLVAAPATTVRRRTWVAQLVRSLVTHGNAYALASEQLDPVGYPIAVETLDPTTISWSHGTNRRLVPHVDGVAHDVWPLGRVVHIGASAFARPGTPVSDSPVVLARQAIGVGLAAEEFGARFFGDGGHPTEYVTSESDLNPEQAAKIKASIMNARRGNREPAVLGKGLTLTHNHIKPDDSQFIDLMRFEVEQACRFFGVPPSMVYAAVSGQNVTYANVSQADLQYLKHGAGIWLADLEDVWSTLVPVGTEVKFRAEALLRLDASARHELYSQRLADKTISINKIHELEDEDPVDDPEFDLPGIPGGQPPASED
ncbi:MAG: phage portal protein [Acidimicrobiales bacterium]